MKAAAEELCGSMIQIRLAECVLQDSASGRREPTELRYSFAR
jgi:hypothetical protein